MLSSPLLSSPLLCSPLLYSPLLCECVAPLRCHACGVTWCATARVYSILSASQNVGTVLTPAVLSIACNWCVPSHVLWRLRGDTPPSRVLVCERRLGWEASLLLPGLVSIVFAAFLARTLKDEPWHVAAATSPSTAAASSPGAPKSAVGVAAVAAAVSRVVRNRKLWPLMVAYCALSVVRQGAAAALAWHAAVECPSTLCVCGRAVQLSLTGSLCLSRRLGCVPADDDGAAADDDGALAAVLHALVACCCSCC